MQFDIIKIKFKAWEIQINWHDFSQVEWLSGWCGRVRGYSFIVYDGLDTKASIAFDYPEGVPRYIKAKIRSEINKLIKARKVAK